MTQQPAIIHSFPESTNPSVEGNDQITLELAALWSELAGIQKELHKLNAIQSPLVGIERVAQYFGKSQDTISRWVNDGVISCYKIPNNKCHALLFSFKQIESGLEDFEQGRY